MSCIEKFCHFVKGEFLISRPEQNCFGLSTFGCPEGVKSYKKLGNIITADIEHTEQFNGDINRFHQGFNPKAYLKLENITLSAQISIPSNSDLALLLRSKYKKDISGSETLYWYEFCADRVLEKCTFINLNNRRNITNLVVQVIDQEGLDSGAPWVFKTDYDLNNGLLEILEDYTFAENEKGLKITFDYNDSETAEFELDSIIPKQSSVLFRGTNFKDQGQVDVEIYRFSPLLTQNFEVLQQENYLTLSLQGKIERFYDDDGNLKHYKIKRG